MSEDQTTHEVDELIGWNRRSFTWRCRCGVTNKEQLPEDGIAGAAPGRCSGEESA